MTRIGVMLGDGFEPVEAVGPVDVMRRAGLDVVTVSINDGREAEAAQGVHVFADAVVGDFDLGSAFDMLVVPGGSLGVENLSKCQPLLDALVEFMHDGKWVASICAGPTILAKLQLLDGYTATCYPGCETDFPAGVFPDEPGVYTDRNLITASGPAYALEFGKAIVAALVGQETADKVAGGMLF